MISSSFTVIFIVILLSESCSYSFQSIRTRYQHRLNAVTFNPTKFEYIATEIGSSTESLIAEEMVRFKCTCMYLCVYKSVCNCACSYVLLMLVLFMYLCMYLYKYIYVCFYVLVHVCICMYLLLIHLFMYICICVYLCIYGCIHMYAYVSTYVCVCECTYEYMYICVYSCIYVFISVNSKDNWKHLTVILALWNCRIQFESCCLYRFLYLLNNCHHYFVLE